MNFSTPLCGASYLPTFSFGGNFVNFCNFMLGEALGKVLSCGCLVLPVTTPLTGKAKGLLVRGRKWEVR